MTEAQVVNTQKRYTPGAERLLAAASELFYRDGIHAVGVDAIAAAAGVTKKTLYDRFGSKESLVLAYLQRRDSRWVEYLNAELAQVPGTGFERILAVFDIAERWAITNSAKGCSAINARAEVSDASDPVAAEAIRQKKWMRNVFATLCREVGLKHPDRVADVLMLLYEGGLVTLGMGTFERPFGAGKAAASVILSAEEMDSVAPSPAVIE